MFDSLALGVWRLVTETTGPRKLYSIVLLEWEVARLSKESAVAIQV